MRQLINETIEAFDLFSQGMLSEEDIYNGIQAGLISESLFNELSETYLLEFELSYDYIKSAGKKLIDDHERRIKSINDNVDTERIKRLADKAKLVANDTKNTIQNKVESLTDKPWYVDIAKHLHDHATHYGIGAAALGAAGAGYAAYKYFKNKKAKK